MICAKNWSKFVGETFVVWIFFPMVKFEWNGGGYKWLFGWRISAAGRKWIVSLLAAHPRADRVDFFPAFISLSTCSFVDTTSSPPWRRDDTPISWIFMNPHLLIEKIWFYLKFKFHELFDFELFDFRVKMSFDCLDNCAVLWWLSL